MNAICNKNKKKEIIITIVLTFLTGLACLAIKSIYPFGGNTIDYYDMAQQIAAFYYHVYDFLHGTKPVFFDFYTALGSNQAMSTSGCSNFSLFNLFFLFVKRDHILESLSILLLIKMVCMSVSMYILLSLNKGLRSYAHIILSVGYGFCGFVLTLYMTNQWMDVAFLFPLILVGLHKLVCDGKPALYVIVLSLALINSYYLSFMILIYVVLILGTKLASDRIFKEKKDHHLLALGVGTAASIGISSFILIPQLMQTLSSSRFNNESGGGLISKYVSILETTEPAYTTRWFSLLGLSFAAAAIVIGLIRNRRDRKLLFNILVPCFIVLLELFLESTNLIWHFGSYVQYPIRNGFMIYVTVAMAAGYMLSDETDPAVSAKDSTDASERPLRSKIMIASSVCILSVLLCVLGIHFYSNNPGMEVRKVFHILAGIMVCTFAVYAYLLLYKNGSYARCLPVLVIAEILLYGYVFIGKPTFITGYTESPEQSGEYIKLCNELTEAFDLKPENIYRMKNPDESLNSNYGLIIRRPVLSNWTHMISPDLQAASRIWGYTVQYTRLLDSGGTAFSDALIGVRNIISRIPQDDKLYALVDTADIEDAAGNMVTYYLYEPRFTLPWVNTIDSSSSVGLRDEDTVSLHNKVYNALGGEGAIAKYVSETKAGKNTTLQLQPAGNCAYYMLGACVDKEYKNTSVNVNGKKILIPSIGEYDNTLYPAYFNCNAVYLGTFDNEAADIEITSTVNGEGQDYKIKIMSLDLDKLRSLCDKLSCDDSIMISGHRIIINKNVSADNRDILIPLAYDDGFSVTDNDRETTMTRYAGLFSKIPAISGNNMIVLTFVPKGMQIGVIISFISILLAIALVILAGKIPILADKIATWSFELIYCTAFMIMYAVPVIYALLTFVRR